jgi:hypothetical protein
MMTFFVYYSNISFHYIIHFALTIPLFHGDSGSSPVHYPSAKLTNNLHDLPWPFSLQFEEPQPQLQFMASIIFHEQHVLVVVMIVFSSISFAL